MNRNARRAVRLLPPLVLLILCALPAHGSEADHEQLLRGVQSIAKPGVPGPLVVFGDNAFAVVAGLDGTGTPHAVVAAARYGKGRVVAFGHGGYLRRGGLETGDTAALVRNAMHWAAGGRAESRVAVVGLRALRDQFDGSEGLTFTTFSDHDLDQALADADVVCLGNVPADAEGREMIRSFVHEGGGLLLANLGWGWLQLNPGRDLREDFAPNQLCAPFGIIWADGYLNSINEISAADPDESLAACHAGYALADLAGHTEGSAPLTARSLALRSRILTTLLQALPPDDEIILPAIRELTQEAVGSLVISAKNPVDEKQPLARLAVLLAHVDRQNQPPDAITADPSSAAFPGAVPIEAERVREIVSIDVSVPGWASTGLYAAPGEVVVIELPAGAVEYKLVAQIGCHTDRLWGKPRWKRHPEITRRFPLRSERTEIASPFGGLLYIDVPRGGDETELAVAVDGAVRAPHFVLGATDPEEWRNAIRNHAAPWAELETSSVILTTQSSAVRTLDDPVSLLEKWDEALACYAELGMRPLPARPERMVPDVQISAGYMHSGYPIMMHLDQVDRLVDPANLDGAWGYWHELGHNHQQASWTFAGTTEVTCNLFTLYVIERLTGVPAAQHQRVLGQKDKIERYIADGAPFDRWKRKPILALAMYMQLQEAFGWEAYKAVFAEYRDLPRSERPRTDSEERDQWMVRFSREVNRNLGPFFKAWGVPVSEDACRSIEDLDVWMPATMQ